MSISARSSNPSMALVDMYLFLPRLTTALLSVVMMLSIMPPRLAMAAELVMIDAKHCVVCRRFNKEAAPHYAQSPAAKVFPLRRIDINTGTIDIKLELPVTMTPTFIFADKGVEMARFYGYPGREHFFELVNGVADEFRKMKAEDATKAN